MRQPLPPGGAFGQCGERVDQRNREIAQVREVGEFTIEPRRMRVVFALDRGSLQAFLGFETGESPIPAVAAADDGGIDE